MVNAIFNHRSIRKFKNINIDEDTLNLILEAGSRASTTGNMQVYSIIVTKDESLKRKLWESHFKQDMVLQAPVVITFCADFNRFNKWCNLRKAKPGYDNFLSFFTASIDALLAAQNVAIAAEEKGLGICYLGTTTYMAKNIIQILELPQHVVPVTTLVVGYPDENPGLTDRLPLNAVVHYEKYKDFSDNEIEEIYNAKERLPENLEFVKINNADTLAQVFTNKRYTKKDNIEFSKLFLEAIHNQNFMNNFQD
jgi:nitroreductase